MKPILLFLLFISTAISSTAIGHSQTPASVDEVMSVFNGKNILITYEYNNTNYSVNVNYCTNKQFKMTSTTTTSTELGGDQVSVTEYRGTWNITPDNGYNCVHYAYSNNSRPPFLEPVYKQPNGTIYISGKNMNMRGSANCL